LSSINSTESVTALGAARDAAGSTTMAMRNKAPYLANGPATVAPFG
jgi:hypothetical protein